MPYSWLPFGIGPRNCVGQRLAYLEAKIALAYLVRHFELLRTPKTEVPIELKNGSNLTSPKNAIYLGARERV